MTGSYGSVLTHYYAGKSTYNKWNRTDIGIENIYTRGGKPVLSCCHKIVSTVWWTFVLQSSWPSLSLKNRGLWAYKKSSSARCQNFCLVRMQEKIRWQSEILAKQRVVADFPPHTSLIKLSCLQTFLNPLQGRERLSESNCHQSRINFENLCTFSKA